MKVDGFKLELLNLHELDIAKNCIHCGLCLPNCPTYSLTKNEISSPRGRINLIREANESKILSKEFLYEINFCLDCQACETVCPAGIKYGKLIERARNYSSNLESNILKKFFKKVILFFTIENRISFLLLSKVSRFLQQIFIFKLLSNLFSKLLLFPKLSQFSFSQVNEEFYPAKVKKRFSVALQTGCVMDIAFSKVHIDTIEILQQQGCDVYVPKNQGCCGSIHGHNGELATSHNMAEKLKLNFDIEKYDAIITNSAGCGAFMKNYSENFNANEFELFSNKVKDLSEFLFEINFISPPKQINQKVTYHDPCHLAHTQKITNQPREIIKKLNGVKFVELNEANWCCGSAGIYNITHFDDSMKILDRKISNISATNADYCVTSNPGCLIQLDYGLKDNQTKTIHIASLIRMGYD